MQVTARIDDDIKPEFEKICKNIGLSLSGAFNVFAHAVVREKRIPFMLSDEDDMFYSISNLSHIKRGLEQLKSGNCIVHELIGVDDEKELE
jgi:DNA-damage-inducible protein J